MKFYGSTSRPYGVVEAVEDGVVGVEEVGVEEEGAVEGSVAGVGELVGVDDEAGATGWLADTSMLSVPNWANGFGRPSPPL